MTLLNFFKYKTVITELSSRLEIPITTYYDEKKFRIKM